MGVDKKAKDETALLAANVLAKHGIRISSSDASGNAFMVLSELAKYTNAPIAIAWADVPTETTNGNLLPNRLYKITGAPAPLTQDLYFTSYFDITAGLAAMSPFGINCTGGSVLMQVYVDWYNGGTSIKRIYEFVYDNDVSGATNITNFIWNSDKVQGNRVGSGFTLNLSSLGTKKFKNNTCFGNKTYTPNGTRDIENIDLSKGGFDFDFQFSFDGTPNPDGGSIEIQTNELGVIPTIAHTADGEFRISAALAGAFGSTIAKCNIIQQHIFDETSVAVSLTYNNDTRLDLFTWDSISVAKQDKVVSNYSVRIRVYFD